MAQLIHDIITKDKAESQPSVRGIISKLRPTLHKTVEATSKKLHAKKAHTREAELIDIVSRFRTRR